MKNIPTNPGVIADENVPTKDVRVMERYGLNPLCIKNVKCGMSDEEVKSLGDKYGGITIATYNIDHFQDYSPLIPLKRDTPIKKTLEYLGYA